MGHTDFWREKNVFITGATGILGSWLTATLVGRRANVHCLIRDSVARSNFYLLGLDRKVTIIQGDLVDYYLVQRILHEYEIEICFHLAAQAVVPIGNRSPLSTFESNIKGTWNLLEAVRSSRILKGLIIASSDKAYGPSDELPYREEHPLKGIHPYDVSKSCVDLLAQAYFHTYRTPLVIARCGNIYGGGDLNFSRLIPGTIRSVLLGENPIIRSDGSLIRDYIYVEDVAEAYVLLSEAMGRPEIVGQAFNFGTEKPSSVKEVVGEILEIAGRRDLRPTILNNVTGEIPVQFLACGKAKQLLGWSHRFDLKVGLTQTFQWYKSFFSKY